MLEPTSEENIGALTITLAPNKSHESVEKKVLEIIHALTIKDIQRLLKKVIQKTLTDELFSRSSSVAIAMELTEYASADAWETFNKTEKMLDSITAKQLIAHIKKLFQEEKLTIGYFVQFIKW